MQVEFMYSKIHRATVTEANIDYVGSITIDKALLDASGMFEGQRVDILNVTNGERFNTYIIEGKENSGVICINGAAAHKAGKGDLVIIVSYATGSVEEAKNFKPSVVHVNSENKII